MGNKNSPNNDIKEKEILGCTAIAYTIIDGIKNTELYINSNK